MRWLALIFSVTFAACATSPADIVVHDSVRGTVAIDRVRSLQAAHPVGLEPGIIAAALRGIHVTEESHLTKMFSSEIGVVRVFSEDDAQFLAPLIADALRLARADQLVRASVLRSGALQVSNDKVGAGAGSSDSVIASRNERTTATLYVYGMSLYLTLTEYHRRDEPADTVNMPNRRLPDPTGLGDRKVVFLPESAVRPESYKPKGGWLGSDNLPTLAIDYQQLGKAQPVAERVLPAPPQKPQTPQKAATPSPAPVKPADAQSDEVQAMKDLVIKKDLELESLKKELQNLKKKLGEQSR